MIKILSVMKSLFGALLFIMVLFTACADDSLRSARGVVKQLNDSSITAIIDDTEYSFDRRDASMKGALMVGDSVEIQYIGKMGSDKSRALLLELIETQGRVVEVGLDESKELLTADPVEFPDDANEPEEKINE